VGGLHTTSAEVHRDTWGVPHLRADGPRATRGPVARYVWDLADRESSRWAVPLGADGVPGAPHHHDQLPPWTAGDLAPVVTDRARLTKESDL
jgi:penicillin amidase